MFRKKVSNLFNFPRSDPWKRQITCLSMLYQVGKYQLKVFFFQIEVNVPDSMETYSIRMFNLNRYKQYSGSGSFWASRIQIHYSEVRIRILPSSSKNSKETFGFYYFVNVPSKGNKQNKLLASWGHLQKEQDPKPNPLVRGTDPRIRIRIRIRTKMSWFWSSGTQDLLVCKI